MVSRCHSGIARYRIDARNQNTPPAGRCNRINSCNRRSEDPRARLSLPVPARRGRGFHSDDRGPRCKQPVEEQKISRILVLAAKQECLDTEETDEYLPERVKITGEVSSGAPLRQEPEDPFNNATSRGLRREPPAGAGGLQVADRKSVV